MSNNAMSNHYAVLGVLPAASTAEIKASYRQLAKRFHPDVPGGNARFFARIREAYDVLCDPERRRVYDARYRRAAPRAKPAREAPADTPMAVLTRIMSITVPRDGRFQLQGLIGDIHVVPTTTENLWDTTLRKYQSTDRERLARHVIQIKLSGEHSLVRSMMPRPTDFGVEFEQATPEEKQNRLRAFLEGLLNRGGLGGNRGGRGFGMYGARLPLALQVTVPLGTRLFLRDVTGSITVGNVEGEVVAKLLGGVLRTGRVSRAHLTLNGGAQAFITDARGPVDVMGFGTSRTLIGGHVTRLRAVLENQSRAEVTGSVDELLAEVNGMAQLDVKRAVGVAHCDVTGRGQVNLARVQRLTGQRSAQGRVKAVVSRRPMPKAG